MNKNGKTKRRVIIFIGIMLTWGWICAGINVITNQPQGIESLGSLLWVLSPLVLVSFMRTIDHEWKESGILPHFRGNGMSYLFAVAFYPLLTLLTVGLGFLFGQLQVSHFTWREFLPAMALSVGVNFFRNISEEIGWRGYLTQKLLSLNMKRFKVYVITGLVWNLWHGAYYMIFTPEEALGGTSRYTLLIWGCVLLIVWSVLFGEIYQRTKSIWPCVILHAFEDGVPTLLLMSGGFLTVTKVFEWFLHPITGIFSVLITLSIGILLYIKNATKTKEQRKNDLGLA